MLPNIVDRLRNEVTDLAPSKFKIKFIDVPERKNPSGWMVPCVLLFLLLCHSGSTNRCLSIIVDA